MRHFFAPQSLRLALVAMLALSATLLSAQAVWACEATNEFDLPRPCTFLEEHGECLVSAYDSLYECEDNAEGWIDLGVCHIAVQVDLFACNMELPFRLLTRVLGVR